MDEFKVKPIIPINADTVQRVLSCPKLTDVQKADFLKHNEYEVKAVMKTEISKQDFAYMMKHRPLKRGKPIKNSFTKRGDKILLGEALGINPHQVDNFISNIIKNNFDPKTATEKEIGLVKTYVFRHGKQEEALAFLDHELSNPVTVLQKLYKILDENDGGLVEYYSRPIHYMNNKTLEKIYTTIDKRLKNGIDIGGYSEEDSASIALWALSKIYEIQNNSKLIRAGNAYKDLVR